ncbi:unnamed protein product, partial [Choristocarpus tenellus]
MGECANVEIVGNERHKDRLCINCPVAQEGSEGTGPMGNAAAGRGRGKGKGKCNARSAGRSPSRQSLFRPPSRSETGDMEKCMTENTALHDLRPLDPTLPLDGLKDFAFRNAPKLAIVSIATEPRLLNDKEATNTHLRQVMRYLQVKIHSQGTIALFVPHPWAVPS